jgi:NAD+ synthase
MGDFRMTDAGPVPIGDGRGGRSELADPGRVGDVLDVATLDAPDAQRDRIVDFIADRVREANADGVVVNMSGGLDSTVTAALATAALGPEHVYGLILPCNKTGAVNARDAEGLAEALGIEHDTVHLQPLFAQFGSLVPDRFDLHDEPALTGNLIARLRMSMAYLAANATDRLVIGTTNRSERLLGYLTKHGDGAADLLPIGHLYKTDVRALADSLDVPEFVTEKRPTAGFLPGHYDRDDLGAPYDTVDAVLALAVDAGMGADAIADRIDVDEEVVSRLLDRHDSTDHKRSTPPIPSR